MKLFIGLQFFFFFFGKLSWNKQLSHVDIGNLQSLLSHKDTDDLNFQPLLVIFQFRPEDRSLSSGETIGPDLYHLLESHDYIASCW